MDFYFLIVSIVKIVAVLAWVYMLLRVMGNASKWIKIAGIVVLFAVVQAAILITTFDVGDKLTVKHSMMSLRHLPYTAMSIVELTAKKNVRITPMSVIEAPNHLVDVKNTYSEIDRPHVKLPLLSSVGKSPSGKHLLAAKLANQCSGTHRLNSCHTS